MQGPTRLGLAIFALWLTVSAVELWADSSSAPLRVSVTVHNNCTLSTTPLVLGPYDSIAPNVAASLEGTGTVTIACTKGAATAVGISRSAATGRQMSGGTTRITYDLYKDSSRAGVWDHSSRALLDSDVSGNRNPRSFTVNGRIPAGQGVSTGSPAAAVTATVNF